MASGVKVSLKRDSAPAARWDALFIVVFLHHPEPHSKHLGEVSKLSKH